MISTRISIITINYNDCKGLKKTINSVISQTYEYIEYIVIDGNSSDNSLSIIEDNSKYIDYYVSEPDKGIYDAMNKGIKKATGDYILFQNSGDWLYNKYCIEKAVKHLKGDDIIYGNLISVFPNTDRELNKGFEGKTITFKDIYAKMLPHPATFYKTSLFNTLGNYDTDLKILSDWKFLIHAIIFNKSTTSYINQIICNYDMTGISSTNKDLMRIERLKVLNEFLPAPILEDYKNYYYKDQLLNSNRFKLLKALESSIVAKKILSIILRLMLKVFKNKTLKDL